MSSEFIFDREHARQFVTARQDFLQPILHDLRAKLQLESAADVGCGVGYFSEFLNRLGFHVVGLDGRLGNVEEARRRHPNLVFKHSNVEDTSIAESYDLVLCLGLLYHLENPVLALRNLSKMTGKLLLIESYATPQRQTALYLREEAPFEDQSLTSLALYPSWATLVKICYRVGFCAVYGFRSQPQHEDFRDHRWRKRQRRIFLASRTPLDLPYLTCISEPQDLSDPWQTASGGIIGLLGRIKRRMTTALIGNPSEVTRVARDKVVRHDF